MKSLNWLLSSILQDCGMQCGANTHLDYLAMIKRIEKEGLSFLTITLSNFCSDFERSLSVGYVDSSVFVGFAKTGCLPKLLSGFTSQIFDKGSGKLLNVPSVDCVRSIRQICLMWKKINLPCAEKRISSAFTDFIKCENELESQCDGISERHRYIFQKISSIVWNTIPTLDTYSRMECSFPKHGPGATAERTSGNQKYALSSWHLRLEPFFPFDAYGLSSHSFVERIQEVKFVEPEQELPVRVITVPKTLKTPRIIAIEPVCMQYTQQALMRFLVESISRSDLTGGHVNFDDQSVNQKLALESSKCGTYCTLDLKEASDRVSAALVDLSLRSRPDLLGPIMSCRSTRAKLPSGYVLALKKFASMGSALCFPVESMIFYIIVLSCLASELNVPLTYHSLKTLSRGIYVFGDDIIVPSDMAPAVIKFLSSFGMKVNLRKSFWTGKFRESCGMDAFDGRDVTPTYLRRLLPSHSRDYASIVSFVSFCNQLYLSGYWRAARDCRRWFESQFCSLPTVGRDASCLGWFTYDSSYDRHRWNDSLHRFEVKSLTIVPKVHNDNIDDHPRLLKFFLTSGKQSDDCRPPNPLWGKVPSSLESTDSFTLKNRWSRPY